ncbi:helix-turn-helix domain-containing protein [Brevundimonas sp. GCM10030266]|uniref:helix-turn-helix domain-containing protein n=1 Tax=Brevundimonas sp. GCM10030266 TaxID=3273386 RepID=UPI00360F8460
MDIVALRKELGLSQEAFAAKVGLRSKGHVSDLERSQSASVRVALEIEKLSGGRIRARDLNPDVAMVEAFRASDAANDTLPHSEAA